MMLIDEIWKFVSIESQERGNFLKYWKLGEIINCNDFDFAFIASCDCSFFVYRIPY